MQIFQPRFPNSKGSIRFLRVVRVKEISAVAKVTHYQKKELKVIAECTIEPDVKGNQVFVTAPGDAGHLDLCKLLFRKNIKGRYLPWLWAVDNGDEEQEKENRSNAIISFELDLIDEDEASTWTIN